MIKIAFLLLVLVGLTPEVLAWSWHGKAPTQQATTGSESSEKPEASPTKLPQEKDSQSALNKPQPDAEEAADITAYNKGVELFQIAQIQLEKGNQSGQKALLKEALRQFETALKANPKRLEADSNIGFVYLTLHEYSDAIKAFKRALALSPEHLNTLNGLATTYTLTAHYREAMALSDQLVTLAPGEGQYWFNRGSLFQKAGRPVKAREAYQKALLVNPSDQRALFNMAALAEDEVKLDDARQLYSEAKDAGIDTPVGLEAMRRLEALPLPNAVGPAAPLTTSKGKH